MKPIKVFSWLCCSLLLLSACDKDKENPNPDNPDNPETPVQKTFKDEDVIDFDDYIFQQFCLKRFDLNQDGEVSYRETKNVLEVELLDYALDWEDLRSIKGIEYFTKLKRLHLIYPVEYLDLSNNLQLESLTLWSLTAFPTGLWRLKNLKELHLNCSNLPGCFPAEIGQLKNLRELHLEHNKLPGSIPAEIGKLEKLEKLYLSGNNFTGNIPAEIGQLKNLKQLRLERNNLTGSIPAALDNLQQLKDLDLSHNKLTGPVPPVIKQKYARGYLLPQQEGYGFSNYP